MNIRTRIFLIFILVVGGGYAFFVNWVSNDLHARYNESLEEPLIDMAHILAELLAQRMIVDEATPAHTREAFSRIYARQFSARVYELEKNRVDMRVYVTDKAGIVQFDSDNGRDEGRDYSRWNDVARTLKGKYGARSTSGDPLFDNGSVVYVAAPILIGKQIAGVVSVGKPKRNIALLLDAARTKLVVVAIIGGLLVLIVGFLLYRWVSAPLQKLSDYAVKINQGERAQAPHLGKNEVGRVGDAMEAMRRSLDGKEYIERYVQTLTHELKSPLSAIKGAAELLVEEMPHEQRRRFSQNIVDETGRLEDIADRLLNLASLEKRNAPDNVENIDMRELIDQLSENLALLADQTGLRLHNEVPIGCTVPGERFLVRQALNNLIVNACEFSTGGGEISVRTESESEHSTVLVSDQGPGIPSYAMGKVFDRFYSLPRPQTDRKSTGLGLNFVKEIAELHGGSITLESTERGTTARLKLPRRSAASP